MEIDLKAFSAVGQKLKAHAYFSQPNQSETGPLWKILPHDVAADPPDTICADRLLIGQRGCSSRQLLTAAVQGLMASTQARLSWQREVVKHWSPLGFRRVHPLVGTFQVLGVFSVFMEDGPIRVHFHHLDGLAENVPMNGCTRLRRVSQTNEKGSCTAQAADERLAGLQKTAWFEPLRYNDPDDSTGGCDSTPGSTRGPTSGD